MAGGQTALALRLLLAVFSSKLSSDINRPFGDEVVEFKKQHINLFVYGINSLQFCSRKVSEEFGTQIVLGDRPIEITVCTYA